MSFAAYGSSTDIVEVTADSFRFNGDDIATESWVNDNFISLNDSDDYVHSESCEDISIAATTDGIVIRKNGAVIGQLFYD